jgi:hypothetical protein
VRSSGPYSLPSCQLVVGVTTTLQLADLTLSSAKWGKAFLETMTTGDLPKNKDMPDRDPLEDEASAPFEAEAGNIVADAEEMGKKELGE